MSGVAIKIENVSKQYRLGLVSTGTLSHDLNRWWATKVMRKEDPYLKIGEVNDRTTKGSSDYVWALKDINMEIKQKKDTLEQMAFRYSGMVDTLQFSAFIR